MARPPGLEEGTKVRLRGVLREEPVIRGQSQSFSLQGVKVRTRRFPEYHYGDYLIITGRMGVRALNYPQIEKLQTGKTPKLQFFSWIFRLKEKIEGVYNQVLPEPQASLLSGIVLGSKKGLPYEFSEQLKKTGTMHVVVASGANITLFAKPLVEHLSRWVSRKLALPLAFVFIWLYVLLSGFEPPVVRAAIMASLAFLAQFLGKQKYALRGLIFAAVLMILVNPLVVFDLGFQLSLAATLGILLFYQKLRPFFQRLSFFGDDFSTTLAAQVFVLPLIYFHFRKISWLSPLVNAFVLWTIDPLMRLGGIIALFAPFSRRGAQLLAYPAWLLLTFFVEIIKFF